MNNPIDYWYQKYLQEKKRADNLQSTIEAAEDHAYLAEQEAMREQMIDKAVEWLENNLSQEVSVISGGYVHINFENSIKEFRKAMEKQL